MSGGVFWAAVASEGTDIGDQAVGSAAVCDELSEGAEIVGRTTGCGTGGQTTRPLPRTVRRPGSQRISSSQTGTGDWLRSSVSFSFRIFSTSSTAAGGSPSPDAFAALQSRETRMPFSITGVASSVKGRLSTDLTNRPLNSTLPEKTE